MKGSLFSALMLSAVLWSAGTFGLVLSQSTCSSSRSISVRMSPIALRARSRLLGGTL